MARLSRKSILRIPSRTLASIIVALVLACGMTMPVGLAAADQQAGDAGRGLGLKTVSVQDDDGEPEEVDVDAIVANMSLDEKISQMIIPAIRTWEGENVTDLDAVPELAAALQRHQYGGVILYGTNVKTTEQVTGLVSDLQVNNAAIKASTNIPYLMPVDEEGGVVVRLNSGTRMTGSMAIGATGDKAASYAKATGQVIGKELDAVGFNADFAPSIDVNVNPANPTIGTRAFSDVPATVTELGRAFSEGLALNDVIATYKHFPGHGDTAVDSHTGLPSVDKTREVLEAVEFAPFRSIAKEADMIMTAHVLFPGIDDKVTYADGTVGCYPATMSKKLMNDILRTDMGFSGVAVADALEMDALYESRFVPGEVAKHTDTLSASDQSSTEYKVNLAEKIINAGVDILLVPADLNTAGGIDKGYHPDCANRVAFYDAYIDGIKAKVADGAISQARIDESVTRILQMKQEYRILDVDTSGDDTAERIAYANEIVGSQDHHDVEARIAAEAVTLVKNGKRALPLSAEDCNTVFVGRMKGDNVGIVSGIKDLQDEGIVASDAYIDNLATGVKSGSPKSATKITIDYYFDSKDAVNPHYTDELKAAVRNADAVVVISTNWGINTLQPTHAQYKGVSGIIADAHAVGAQAVLLSCNLPYDVARYQDADAIMMCYMSTGIDLDPTARREGAGFANAYNANVPAAIDALYGKEVSGTLPVNVPKMVEKDDGTVAYSTTDILYPRGWGLTYESSPGDADDVTSDDVVIFAPKSIEVKAGPQKVVTYKTTAQSIGNPLVVTNAKGAVSYSKLAGSEYVSIDRLSGQVTLAKGMPVGSYTVTVRVDAAGDLAYDAAPAFAEFTVKVDKAAGKLKVKAAKATRSVAADKKTVVKAKKAFKVKKNLSGGKLVYKKAKGDKKIKVSKKGKITVAKGLKKGKAYPVKVKVTSKATENYNAAKTTVKFKVKAK